MKEENNWENLKEIQDAYFGTAYQYLKKESHKDLKEKLTLIDSSYVVLRLLGAFSYHDIKEEVDFLFEEIVELSIDGNPTQIVLARKIIYSIDRTVINEKLRETIQNIINEKVKKENGFYLHRNIDDLLFSLGFNNYNV